MVRVSASRVVSEEVLRTIALNKEWIKNYQMKLNLIKIRGRRFRWRRGSCPICASAS